MPKPAKSNVDELKATVVAFEKFGFRLVDLQGGTATFQNGATRLRIVNDRGFWFVAGDDDDLKGLPMRKSRGRTTKDAIEWIKRKSARSQL